MRLTVAGLELALDLGEGPVEVTAPPAVARFVRAAGHGEEGSSRAASRLTLSLRDGPLRDTRRWQPLYANPGTWQLWLDEAGRYVFAVGENSPPCRQVTVDRAFRSGEVLGRFGPDGRARYPLDGIDTMLFANWLADTGDLILHASGVAIGDRGYAFAGVSGAGKSTVAAALMAQPGVTVLGEDSLILRLVDGRFRVYGTPWHVKPAMCSPGGAPLKKLFFLDRAAPAGVRPCGALDGVSRLLQTAFVPYYRPDAVARITDNLALLAERVPFYWLSYRLGTDPMTIIEA